MNGIPADLVLKNGNIITVDAHDTIAEATAVLDGKFVRVGSNDDVAPLIGEATRVIDLAGKTLVPGFIDAHTHPVSRSCTVWI
jgi:predicted amidohydrolase YtcJ